MQFWRWESAVELATLHNNPVLQSPIPQTSPTHHPTTPPHLRPLHLASLPSTQPSYHAIHLYSARIGGRPSSCLVYTVPIVCLCIGHLRLSWLGLVLCPRPCAASHASMRVRTTRRARIVSIACVPQKKIAKKPIGPGLLHFIIVHLIC